MKLKAQPDLANVTDWPYRLEGEIEVVDGGVSSTESLEAATSSFCAVAKLHGLRSEIGFELSGDVLLSAGISPEELDDPSARFAVSVEPISGEGIPVALDGKMELIQRYRAVAIERAE